MDTNYVASIEKLLEAIKNDYHQSQMLYDRGTLSDYSKGAIDRFNAGIRAEYNRKYTKIISDNSVWGFVVAVNDDAKFKLGDILRAASWSIPARNASRGNIFGNYSIRWTGPGYLRNYS